MIKKQPDDDETIGRAHGTPARERKRFPIDSDFPYQTPYADERPAVAQAHDAEILAWLYSANRDDPAPAYVRLIDPLTTRVGEATYRRFAVHPSGVPCFAFSQV